MKLEELNVGDELYLVSDDEKYLFSNKAAAKIVVWAKTETLKPADDGKYSVVYDFKFKSGDQIIALELLNLDEKNSLYKTLEEVEKHINTVFATRVARILEQLKSS